MYADDTGSTVSRSASSIEILSDTSSRHIPLIRKLASIIFAFVMLVVVSLVVTNVIVTATSIVTNSQIVLDLEDRKRTLASDAVVTSIDNIFAVNKQIMQSVRYALFLNYNDMTTFFTNQTAARAILNLLRAPVIAGLL
jgi:hypothetical protein